MLARNSLLEETLPSISTATKVGARSWSRALVSLTSMALFHAFSKPRTRPPSSLVALCAKAKTEKAARARNAVTNPIDSFFMGTPRRLRNVVHQSGFRIRRDSKRRKRKEVRVSWRAIGVQRKKGG